MYNLTIQNNSHLQGQFFYKDQNGHSQEIIVNQHHTNGNIANLSNAYLVMEGMGSLNLIDLGTEKIANYPLPEGEYGLLIRTHTTEAYCRYNGIGEFKLTIDKLGSYSLEAIQGQALKIKLEELIIK